MPLPSLTATVRTRAMRKRGTRKWFLACVALLSIASCAYLQDFRDERPGIRMSELRTAPGYTVNLMSDSLPKARQMALDRKSVV